MKANDVRKFKMYIAQYISKKYGTSESVAMDAVQSSKMNILLREDPESIMHDSIQYWADEVWNEYNCLMV